jgi:hypothetical protein
MHLMPMLRILWPVVALAVLAGCTDARKGEPQREQREEKVSGDKAGEQKKEAAGQQPNAPVKGRGQKTETGGTPQQLPVKNTLISAEDTVRAFLELDGTGSRLTSQSQSRIFPYVAWKDERQADTVIVISGFDLIRTERQNDAAILVTVRYSVLGKLSRDYQKQQESETVTFTVRKTDAGWKITSPDTLPPHVYINPVISHLERSKNLDLAEKIQSGRGD